MLQLLAVTVLDRIFILELRPLGHNTATISHVLCVVLSVMLHQTGKAACSHFFLVCFQEMMR